MRLFPGLVLERGLGRRLIPGEMQPAMPIRVYPACLTFAMKITSGALPSRVS